MRLRLFIKRVPVYVWVVAIALVAALPLWQPGFLNTKAAGETPYLLARVHQMAGALREGVFPVRWMPDGAYGLGYPFFNFYGALPYYVASVLHILGLGIVASLKVTHTIGFILGAAGTYLWMRRHVRAESAAVLAAAVFTFAPMHMVNSYIRGDSLSEFWAMGLFPLVLWAIDRVIACPRPGAVVLLGVCGAGIVISHNISALLFLPLSAVYGIWMLTPKFHVRRFAGLATGGVLAVLLSAWFWLPAIVERDTVQVDGRMLEGYFYWGNNFLDGQLIQRSLAVDYALFPPRLGLWQALLVGAGLLGVAVVMARRKRLPKAALWAVGVFILSVVMTQSFSSLVYEAIQPLAYLQFTWRWLTITALAGAAVAAYAVEVWQAARLRQVVVALLVGVTALGGIIHLNLDFMPIPESEITIERLAEREFYSGDIGTTVTTEYLSAGMSPRIFSGPIIVDERPLKVLMGEASGALVEQGAVRQVWRIVVQSDAADVAVPILYWAGWRASLDDGTALETTPAGGIYWTQTRLNKGEHTVIFELRNTPIRWTANALSLLAVLIAGCGALRRARIRRAHGVWVSIYIGAVLVVSILPVNGSAVGPEATQFWRNSYRHAYNDGLAFSDGAHVLAYHYPDTVVSGEMLHIDLVWAGQSETVSAELIPPLVNLWQIDVALAVGTGTDQIDVPIPAKIGGGLYFVRLTRNGEVYDLKPVRVLPGAFSADGEDFIADMGGVLRLLDVRTEALDRGRLNVYLNWQVLGAITEYYGLALRLRSADGEVLAAHDGQLGAYGTYPAAYWEAYFGDWVTLPGLEGLPPGDTYRLFVTVYTKDSTLGGVEIRDFMIEESPEQPAQETPPFSGTVALQSTQVEQGEALLARAEWRGAVRDGWQVEWLFGEQYSVMTLLAPGARLDWWRPDRQYHAVLHVPVALETAPGRYAVSWRVVDFAGEPVTVFQDAGQVEILPTSRVFVPPESRPIAAFGGIQLFDYVIRQTPDALVLDFTWGLSERVLSDDTLFVHLVNPDDDFVVAQTDTQPRYGAYPVTAWLAGEQVEDTVFVDLTGVGPGMYRIALGWYVPLNPTERLPVTDAESRLLPDGRLVLPDSVIIP